MKRLPGREPGNRGTGSAEHSDARCVAAALASSSRHDRSPGDDGTRGFSVEQDLANARWALPLPGWDDLSTWGYDTGTGTFFAQLTRNGNNDGPDAWITPGVPAVTTPAQLQALVAESTGAAAADVAQAMNHAVDRQGAPARYRLEA
uniref:hypothetical protein n=1 Tax=Amycolatopsis sp. CA-096443 TaxID=3239919 RepID=UPI003F495E18